MIVPVLTLLETCTLGGHDAVRAEMLPFVRGLPLRMRIFLVLAFLSELVRQCCGPGNTVGLINIDRFIKTQYRHYAAVLSGPVSPFPIG